MQGYMCVIINLFSWFCSYRLLRWMRIKKCLPRLIVIAGELGYGGTVTTQRHSYVHHRRRCYSYVSSSFLWCSNHLLKLRYQCSVLYLSLLDHIQINWYVKIWMSHNHFLSELNIEACGIWMDPLIVGAWQFDLHCISYLAKKLWIWNV